MTPSTRFPFTTRRFLAALALTTLALTLASRARATELVPSVGFTKSTDENAGDGQAFGGLALRVPLSPFLKIEGGIAYRQDTAGDDAFKVRQWPVTASLWLVPVHSVYVGGGVGWYRTTIDFPSAVPLEDVTTNKMGVHAGGGIDIPIASKLALDLGGRYVFMSKEKNEVDIPATWDPDFWTVTAGLSVGF